MDLVARIAIAEHLLILLQSPEAIDVSGDIAYRLNDIGIDSPVRDLISFFEIYLYVGLVEDNAPTEIREQYLAGIRQQIDEAIRLVATKKLSIFVAADEIFHSLDRSEIQSSKSLRPIVDAAYWLERSGMWRQADPERC